MTPVISSTPINLALWNSLGDADAVVIAGVTHTADYGRIYGTIDSAIDSGAKNILVLPGEYSGFRTESADGSVTVRAASRAVWDGAAFSGGVICTSGCVILGKNCLIDGISVAAAATGNGFYIGGDGNVLSDCQACGCAGIGIQVYGNNATIRGGLVEANGAEGIRIGTGSNGYNTLVSGTRIISNTTSGVAYHGASSGRVIGVVSYGNGAYGAYDNTTGVTVIVGSVVSANVSGQIQAFTVNEGNSTA